MNYQKIQDGISIDKASTVLDTPTECLSYFAWPQTFSSTCGPFGGIGGQTLCTFTVEAFWNGKDAVFFDRGKTWKRIDNFDPGKAVYGKYR